MELAAKQISQTNVAKKQGHFFGQKREGPFFAPVLIQPKLAIGPVDDPYEREADAVAERVMRMPDAATFNQPVFSRVQGIDPVQRHCAACEEEDKLQRKEDDEDDVVQLKPAQVHDVQRKCAGCENEERLYRKEDEEEDEQVQLKSAHGFSLQRKCACEDENNISRKQSQGQNIPAVTQSAYQALNSSGQSLDKDTRSFMEQRFGYDFGDVKIHNDELAHRSSKDINALAYTHGNHVVFGAGQYQPQTTPGKQLLAHELTHVIQQGSDNFIRRAVPPNNAPSMKPYFPPGDSTEIQGFQNFTPDTDVATDIYNLTGAGLNPLVKIRYGGMGEGDIVVKATADVTDARNYDVTCSYLIAGVFLNAIGPIPVPLLKRYCYPEFVPKYYKFNADWQTIPISLPGLDTQKKDGTLVLATKIDNSVITGKIGWVAGKTRSLIKPSDYSSADYSLDAFLPFIFGNDYTGNNFQLYGNFYNNSLNNGAIVFNCWGNLSLPNQQSMDVAYQTGDEEFWGAFLEPNILGAGDYNLPVNRTPQGDLSGEGDGISLDANWDMLGMKVNGTLHTSFVNSNLFVMGKARFNSERGTGDVFIAVADYTTAKGYALRYLPEEIGAMARENDKAPENANERLAFVGAGKVNFILIKDLDELRDGKKTGKKKPVAVDASCVVEPEGYITIAGMIKQTAGEFILFNPRTYEDSINIVSIPLITIPGPVPLTSFKITFSVDFNFGATIGPLTLSQIQVSGIYSTRPGSPKELEMSARLGLHGELFAKLQFCIKAIADLGIFEHVLVEDCWQYGPKLEGDISAQPTITVNNFGTSSIHLLPQYSFKGNFDFGAAGQLSAKIKDSFKMDAKEKVDKSKDPKKDPDVYKYKSNENPKEKNFKGKDIMVPLDHVLGSAITPDKISYDELKKANFGDPLNTAINDRGTKEKYFVKGESDRGEIPEENIIKPFNSGDFMEGGQKRGDLPKAEIVEPPRVRTPTYIFTQDFKMKGVTHKLQLIVKLVKKDDKVESIKQVLMMASEMEELTEKIAEERDVITATPEPSDSFQEKDLDNIEAKGIQLKQEVEELALNDKLSEETEIPEMLEVALPLENYANRHKRDDLGIEDKPKDLPKPCPDKPRDIIPGQDIIFDHYGIEGGVKGEVLQIISIPDSSGLNSHWHIKFKPKNGRLTTSSMPRAYNDECKPNYRVPAVVKDCKTKFIYPTEGITVPSRTVGGKSFYGYEKAKMITAVPLCWSVYQPPKRPVVGIDRIRAANRWHRAHLLHGELGGEGVRSNLVPTSPFVNNVIMPAKYEDVLYEAVVKGQKDGKFYWFKAEVTYHETGDNFDIHHYEDFVKRIDIYFGIAEPKDPDHKNWELTTKESFHAVIDKGLELEPVYKDVKSTRTDG